MLPGRKRRVKIAMSRRRSTAQIGGVVDYERAFVVSNSRNIPIIDLLTDVCKLVDQEQVEAVNGNFGNWLIQLKEKEVCKVVAKVQVPFLTGRASFPPITTLSLPKVYASIRESDLRKSLQRYGDVISAIRRSPLPISHAYRWKVKMYIPEDTLEVFPKSLSIETERGRADDFDVLIESSRCLSEEHSSSDESVASGSERKRKASNEEATPVGERPPDPASVRGHLNAAVRRASSTGPATESTCDMQSDLRLHGTSGLHETKETSTPPVKKKNLSPSTPRLRMEERREDEDPRMQTDETPLNLEKRNVEDPEVYVIKSEDDLRDASELPFAAMKKRQRVTMEEYSYWVGERFPYAKGILSPSELRTFLMEARATKRFIATVERYARGKIPQLVLQLHLQTQMVRNIFKEDAKIHPLKNIVAMMQVWIRRLNNHSND